MRAQTRAIGGGHSAFSLNMIRSRTSTRATSQQWQSSGWSGFVEINWPPNRFPHLNARPHAVTSDYDTKYNCIAWALPDIRNFWSPVPGYYWPPGVAPGRSLEHYVAAYATAGYAPCGQDGSVEPGWEKIALYGKPSVLGHAIVEHAARQLRDGMWTSKMGQSEDITHLNVDDVCGPLYGQVLLYLKRPRTAPMCD